MTRALPRPCRPSCPNHSRHRPLHLTLVGVAEQTVDGETVRTAVLSMSTQLYYVKAGERVGAAYEVVAVEAGAVEVKDLVSGAVRRISQP